jgi:hypothetical protein
MWLATKKNTENTIFLSWRNVFKWVLFHKQPSIVSEFKLQIMILLITYTKTGKLSFPVSVARGTEHVEKKDEKIPLFVVAPLFVSDDVMGSTYLSPGRLSEKDTSKNFIFYQTAGRRGALTQDSCFVHFSKTVPTHLCPPIGHPCSSRRHTYYST